MTNYRRVRVAGATYFFSVNLADRQSTLLVDRIDTLRNGSRYVRARHPFVIDAMVVLPEHLHAVWTLPVGDADHSLRWRLLKTAFSRGVPHGERRRESRVAKGERGIWQRRYWEHLIRDDDDFARHVDYIHFNPVKHGHVHRAGDWPYSTLHRYVADGLLPSDWGGDRGQPITSASGVDGYRFAQPILRTCARCELNVPARPGERTGTWKAASAPPSGTSRPRGTSRCRT